MLAVQGIVLPEKVLSAHMTRVTIEDGDSVDLGAVPLVEVGASTELDAGIVTADVDEQLSVTVDVDAVNFDGHPRSIAGSRLDPAVWPYTVVELAAGSELGIYEVDVPSDGRVQRVGTARVDDAGARVTSGTAGFHSMTWLILTTDEEGRERHATP